MFRFELLATCPRTGARRGRLHTRHGTVETPAFMPVATQGAVKTLGSEDLEALGFELVLSNTYHLALRPGAEAIARQGGLGAFMSWRGATLTDSGGFQAMSLARLCVQDEDGVSFRSHLDGAEVRLTPEEAMRLQTLFGVDVAMALDVCAPYPCSREAAAAAMERTLRWARRSLNGVAGGPARFGIVQGGVHEDLRLESAARTAELPFDGYAIGGVSVGEPSELQRPVVRLVAPLLPADKPRYLMGVGHPGDVLHAVAAGVDLFDCVLPTRMARHRCLYTLQGRVNAAGLRFAEDASPIDPEFPSSARYGKAYLRHLFKAGEALGPRLASLHNLAFYARLMAEIRAAIEANGWEALIARYAAA